MCVLETSYLSHEMKTSVAVENGRIQREGPERQLLKGFLETAQVKIPKGSQVTAFLEPVLQAISQGHEFDRYWPPTGPWT